MLCGMDIPQNDHSRTFEVRSTAGRTITRCTGETNAREHLSMTRAFRPASEAYRFFLVECIDGRWERVL
jgi:hypothetical protein